MDAARPSDIVYILCIRNTCEGITTTVRQTSEGTCCVSCNWECFGSTAQTGCICIWLLCLLLLLLSLLLLLLLVLLLLLLNNKNGSDGKCSQCARFWLEIIKGILFGVWYLLQNSFLSGNIYRLRRNIIKSNLTHFTPAH